MEIPEWRRGAKQKTFHGGSMDIFWNYTLLSCATTTTLFTLLKSFTLNLHNDNNDNDNADHDSDDSKITFI